MKQVQKKMLFLTLFTIIGFMSLQIPFNKVVGSNVSFTLFDFFAPIAGSFLGPIFGITSVFTVEVINLWTKQTPLTTGSVIRLFPTLFAVLYFAIIANKKYHGKWVLAIPIVCILAFIAHPIGRQVFYYALMFWTIPVLAYFKRNNLFIKSLGATFTAHAVGGMMWIWAFNLPASIWNSLIPVVITERLLFASGIALSFVVVKHTLNFLAAKKLLPQLDTAKV
ncbi:hypothetical protein A3C26_04115 [Candidatus Daviesbacteria bacterium RIFCSPHIGHO2_02_FULL_39_12]|uniref:Riboflavin transporter n=1 Tax=Candidatus Daviesbacteria bacterium RIFCSPHIGHO2_02_FULL_39_12 TaxID=1797770 RepID=A0A1F5J9V2_9BACT|nr:MAG: hypothetical protein A3C26_04115 [Candidatus Daviesbacteria bacterium RIFCSPHIGHO2_02_FULL_39_12]